jgi:hypothetical protein
LSDPVSKESYRVSNPFGTATELTPNVEFKQTEEKYMKISTSSGKAHDAHFPSNFSMYVAKLTINNNNNNNKVNSIQNIH